MATILITVVVCCKEDVEVAEVDMYSFAPQTRGVNMEGGNNSSGLFVPPMDEHAKSIIYYLKDTTFTAYARQFGGPLEIPFLINTSCSDGLYNELQPTITIDTDFYASGISLRSVEFGIVGTGCIYIHLEFSSSYKYDGCIELQRKEEECPRDGSDYSN